MPVVVVGRPISILTMLAISIFDRCRMHASLYDVFVEAIHWMQRFYERRYKEFSYNMYILVKVNVYQSYQTSPHY